MSDVTNYRVSGTVTVPNVDAAQAIAVVLEMLGWRGLVTETVTHDDGSVTERKV